MRLVVVTEPGTVELAYTWLPVWIGMNSALKKEMEDTLSSKIIGKPLTEDFLDAISDTVVDFLCDKYPQIEGLRDYLDALKFVNIR